MAVIGARCDALNVDTSHEDHTLRNSSRTQILDFPTCGLTVSVEHIDIYMSKCKYMLKMYVFS